MTSVFESVLRISTEAAVLALLVLGARLIVGRRPGLMLTILYALIAIRLIVPFTVSSPLSVHNLWNESQTQIEAAINSSNVDAATEPKSSAHGTTPKGDPAHTEAVLTDVASSDIALFPDAKTVPLTALEIAALVWVAGMIVMIFAILTGNALFMRRIRRNRAYTAPEFFTMLAQCRQTLGLKRNVRAICASETGTAAVYGVFRPVLLISPASFETLTDAQKRHVLLHELSHIRRRDTLLCAGATILNIVHWFNPLVWLVFALMRRDIEVQCDAHVFRGLPGSERGDYAGTLLRLAGPIHTTALAPALFISRANIKRRIVMIVKHRRKSVLFSAVALLLTVLVAVTGCTTAVDVSAEPSAEAAPEVTPAFISGDDKLLGSYTMDYSICADDTARVNNIKKAAALLNGMVFPPDTDFNLTDKLLPLTVENGWLNAPWTSWETTTMEVASAGSIKTTIESAKSSQDMQVGGGIELVLLAIRIAADDIGLSYLSEWQDDSNQITDGDFMLKNEAYSDVILSVSTQSNALTVSFYGTEKPTEALAKPDLMSSFTVDNSQHDNAERMDNIQKAADMINGTVIKPDETISVNDILGPRSVSTGWKAAPGITGGAYVSEIGGGVCAISSALYNAAIRAELEIPDVTHHSIPLDYIDGGLDATISTGSPDLKIKNPYDSDVRIEAKLEDKKLIVSVYGPHRDYTVDFGSGSKKSDELPATEYYYNAATTPDGTEIAPGQSVEYRAARSGITYTVYKTRYDLDGNKIDSIVFEEVTYQGYTGQVYVNGPDPGVSNTIDDSLAEAVSESLNGSTPPPKPSVAIADKKNKTE